MIGPSTPVTPTRPSTAHRTSTRNIHGSPRLRSDTLTAAKKTSFFGSGGGGGSGQEISRQYTIMPKKKFVSEIFFSAADVDGDGFEYIIFLIDAFLCMHTHLPPTLPHIHITNTPE